jgi:GMP synthase (glutamine-hydrolysing)
MSHDRIAVVDFGGQYAHLIATKLRRLRVLAEIRQPEDPPAAYRGFRGIVLSGSPSLASHGQDAELDPGLLALELPVLGLCFGHQQIAKHYGGRVEHQQREYGPARLRSSAESPLFAGLPAEHTVWMSHGDTVTELPPGFVEIGASVDPDGTLHHNAAIADEQRRRYGLQFHPEVDDTEHGDAMLERFAQAICGCRPSWTMDRYREEQVAAVRAQVGSQQVLLLVSGGVDSTVCAKLLCEAIGPERLHLLHVDNGLMRQGESRQVLAELAELGIDRNLHFVDASARFVAGLGGVIEPERKRRIIGDTFVQVFEEQAARLGLERMLLGQGTIYPDTIETGGTRRADVIKTHHNRVPAIERMIAAGRVVEPLRDLYKLEVRELGAALGIDDALLWRHPFPGPGLGVRVLCSDGTVPASPDPGSVEASLAACTRPAGLRAMVLPVRSVGVKADLRCYERPVMLWGGASQELLLRVAAQIYARVPGINRCVLDLSGLGARTAEPVAAAITAERLELARQADGIVMAALERHGLLRQVWQCPTVLLPLRLDGRGCEVVVVRPVLSERAMTARPAELPAALCEQLRASILALPGVGGLLLDVSTKPPATIEWE